MYIKNRKFLKGKGGKMMNQGIVVKKYGGSSIANLEMLGKVAEHIKKTRESGKKVVIILSAMGDTTDELIKLAKASYGGELPSEKDLQDEQNKLLVTGEEQSAPLLALALWRLGVPAVSLTSREIELETDANGRVRVIRGVNEIRSLLDQGKVAVVTGFQGIKETTKMVTILGRGGSDITEIALTASLGEKYCENYTDVDGIFAVDPRIIPEAKRFDQISYYQLIELATAGSGKLNDRAVILAQNLGIEIKVLLSPSFGESTGGTLVCSGSTLEKMESFESQPGLAIQKSRLIRILNIPNKPGMARRIFEPLERINLLNAIQAPAGEKAKISIMCLPKLSDSILSILNKVKEKLLPEIEILEPLEIAELTLVDPLMKDHPSYLARVSRAIGEAEVNIESLSAPGITIAVVVKETDLLKAARALAEEFQLVT